MHFNRISNNLIFKLYRQCTVTGKGVRCMLVSRSVCSVVCCLVTDWFSRSLVSGHLSRRATAGCPRDAGLADKTPQRSGVKIWHQAGGMSQMSKSSSHSGQDSGCRKIYNVPLSGGSLPLCPCCPPVLLTIYSVHAWELCAENLRLLLRTGSTFFLDLFMGQSMGDFITDIYELQTPNCFQLLYSCPTWESNKTNSSFRSNSRYLQIVDYT